MSQLHPPSPRIPQNPLLSSFGQILTSSPNSSGHLQPIDQFKGHKLINISGGFKRIFMFQEVDDNQNVVTALHPEQEDEIKYKDEVTGGIQQMVAALEGLKILEISAGKLHNIIRTEQGHLFSYGKGEFGSLGLGGCVFSALPKIINKLQNRKIVAVSCGAYHSLALSETGDLYSWGRGFEGQLGLPHPIETTSSPQYVTHFFKYDNSKDIKMLKKKPIHKIACGAYHSLAVDSDGGLYAWGQAISGATGTGLKVKEPTPVKLQIKVGEIQRKIVKIAGGFSHSLCLSEEGEVFGWGLNIKGQVGINDLSEGIQIQNAYHNGSLPIEKRIKYKKVVLTPTLLKETRDSLPLPKFIQITCGFSRSFAIDEENQVWGWGGGCLGFKDKFSERGPTKLVEGTDNKKFTKVFANQDSVILFAPFSPTYFKPSLVCSKGGSEMTFFGTGFTDTGNQSVIFKVGDIKQQVKLQYDQKTSTFYCKAVNFQNNKTKIEQPIQCEVSITLDGKKYFPYDRKLLIYPQRLAIQSLQPKAGTAHGGTECIIHMPLHPLIQQYTQTITVGFKSNSTKNQQQQSKLQDWICVQGRYSSQKIHCKFPNIPYFDNQYPFYMVDVSLNGQEFTNHPQTVRFYLISEVVVTPVQGIQTQEVGVSVSGKGLFDTPFKELTLQLNYVHQGLEYCCLKVIETQWNKNQKKFVFTIPTLKWVLGDVNVTEEMLANARKNAAVLKINLSKKDPIQLGKYRFLAPPPPEIPEQQLNKKDTKKDAKKGAKK